MKKKAQTLGIIALSVAICLLFGSILLSYTRPMEDVYLNLSMKFPEGPSAEGFDSNGWTVFLQEGETVTELTSNGGGYAGVALGQTFYYSRVLEEELDSPTLQIGTANRQFSVWLDNDLVYTDCPELDNRIGYVNLPMNEWDRADPITITLPQNYQGKTLTIAQSFPTYSEGGSPRAIPASVKLYCGYAYESGLIAESYQNAFSIIGLFALGVVLLLAFVLRQDWGALCISLAAFAWMAWNFVGTSYFTTYFGADWHHMTNLIQPLAAGALLCFLCIRAERRRLMLLPAVYGVPFLIALAITIVHPVTNSRLLLFLNDTLVEWIGFAGLVTMLVLGALVWRKENRFYRLFTPLAVCGVIVHWMIPISKGEPVLQQIVVSLQSGVISYVYYKLVPAMLLSALIAALTEAARTELEHRAEKRLMQERAELTLASYETLRRQNEEVMMLRHDMTRHFHTLREMSADPKVTDYLTELIGQNEKIRPVVQSGNEVLDIILNGKLSAAIDAGIRVEVIKANAPEKLPLRDADLCSLVMNILDNAINAAEASGVEQPFLRLTVHVKEHYFAIVCENAAAAGNTHTKTKATPKHGFGLKIIRSIAERYEGNVDMEWGADRCKVRVVLPLD